MGNGLTNREDKEDHMGAMLEDALEGSFIIDAQAYVVDANLARPFFGGRARQELVGQSIFTLVPPQRRRDMERLWEIFLHKGEIKGDYEVELAGGGSSRVEYTAIAHFISGYHMAVVRDMTERTRAEEALRHQNEELR